MNRTMTSQASQLRRSRSRASLSGASCPTTKAVRWVANADVEAAVVHEPELAWTRRGRRARRPIVRPACARRLLLGCQRR